jgi:hypothetical protein
MALALEVPIHAADRTDPRRELGLVESTVACTGVIEHFANPAGPLVHLSGSMTLAAVLAAFEGTTYRPVVQRGA